MESGLRQDTRDLGRLSKQTARPANIKGHEGQPGCGTQPLKNIFSNLPSRPFTHSDHLSRVREVRVLVVMGIPTVAERKHYRLVCVADCYG